MATYGYPGAAAGPADDPLVPNRAIGFSSWYERWAGAVRRSWKALVLLAAVTIALPSLVLSLLSSGAGDWDTQTMYGDDFSVTEYWKSYNWGVILLAFVVAILSGYLSALGSAAAIWTITRQAADRPAPLGEALRFGASRALPLWLWIIVAGILTFVGTLCCVLPGIYLSLVFTLVPAIVVYERVSPIPRAFKLFHADLGRALGRTLGIFFLVVALACCLSMPGGLVEGFTSDAGTVVRWLGATIAALWAALLSLFLFAVAVCGALVTYAELRAAETQLSTEQLLAEAS
ncbi:hypothetical protein [Longispora albida]|uniref:hypothetical protein n=1 Tax=Longispora albida TaxID=203523 RepID=UPI0003793757|nr:hypothetical protein [Longispora albida]